MSDDNLNNLNNLNIIPNIMGDEDNRESNGGGNQPFDPFASFMAHVEGQMRELTQHIRIIDKG